MFSFNGIGTKLYGKRDKNNQDNSYIATKWFIILLLPIVPLGSYRVIRGETKTSGFVPVVGATTSYQMVKVDLNWKQVGLTYLTVYGVLIICIALLVIFVLSNQTPA